MKTSELRQIIKEEIDKALNEIDPYEKGMESFKEKIPFKDPNPSAKNMMKYETLPGYADLPATRFDVKNYMNAKYILLPSLESANASSQLYSKEDVKDWFNEWKKTKGEAPQFKVENGKIKVVNADEPNWNAMKGSGD